MIEKKHGSCSRKIQEKLKIAAKILGFTVFGLVLSCKLPDNDMSTELTKVDVSSLSKIVADELKQMDLKEFSVGQELHYEINYRAEMGSVVKLADVLRHVFAVDLSTDGLEKKVSMREDFYTWNNDGSLQDEKHSDVIWRLKMAQTPLNIRSAPFTFKTSDEENPDDATYEFQYFNLRHKKVTLEAPKAIAEKADCGGLESCVLRGTELIYIVKLLKNGQEIDKAEVKTVISRDVPPLFFHDNNDEYLLPIVSDCWTQAFEQKYLVTKCTVLRDMQK